MGAGHERGAAASGGGPAAPRAGRRKAAGAAAAAGPAARWSSGAPWPPPRGASGRPRLQGWAVCCMGSEWAARVGGWQGRGLSNPARPPSPTPTSCSTAETPSALVKACSVMGEMCSPSSHSTRSTRAMLLRHLGRGRVGRGGVGRRCAACDALAPEAIGPQHPARPGNPELLGPVQAQPRRTAPPPGPPNAAAAAVASAAPLTNNTTAGRWRTEGSRRAGRAKGGRRRRRGSRSTRTRARAAPPSTPQLPAWRPRPPVRGGVDLP